MCSIFYLNLTQCKSVTPKLSSPIHMGDCVLVFVCLSNLVRFSYCLTIQILIENDSSTLTFTVFIFIKDVEACKIKPPGKSEPYVMAKKARHEGGRLQYIGG